MTEQEALKIYEEMLEMFGDKIPNPDHCPREFAYFVMLYKHCKKNGY
jgi:hypothetical protein